LPTEGGGIASEELKEREEIGGWEKKRKRQVTHRSEANAALWKCVAANDEAQ